MNKEDFSAGYSCKLVPVSYYGNAGTQFSNIYFDYNVIEYFSIMRSFSRLRDNTTLDGMKIVITQNIEMVYK